MMYVPQPSPYHQLVPRFHYQNILYIWFIWDHTSWFKGVFAKGLYFKWGDILGRCLDNHCGFLAVFKMTTYVFAYMLFSLYDKLVNLIMSYYTMKICMKFSFLLQKVQTFQLEKLLFKKKLFFYLNIYSQ